MWQWLTQKLFGGLPTPDTAPAITPVCDYCSKQTQIFAKPSGRVPSATVTLKKTPPEGAKDLNFTWTEERETGIDQPWQARCPLCDSIFTWIPPYDSNWDGTDWSYWRECPGKWVRGFVFFDIRREKKLVEHPDTFKYKSVYHHYHNHELIQCENCGSIHMKTSLGGGLCEQVRCACGTNFAPGLLRPGSFSLKPPK